MRRIVVVVCFSLLPLVSRLSAADALNADWPQWRGPTRDAVVPGGDRLSLSLPASPKTLWKVPVGPGHSSPVLSGGRLVYTDSQGGQETVHVLDAATGKEFWQAAYGAEAEDEWGNGPRSTPMIDDDRVYVQSCRGEFRCLKLADGKEVWSTSFEKDYGVKFVGSKASSGTASRRGNNGAGVIDGDRVFVPVGSTAGATVVCFEKRTGKELWRSLDDEAAYSSLVVFELAGVRQLVAFTATVLSGLSLDDGKTLWQVPVKTGARRNVATPVRIGDTVVVNSHTVGIVASRVSKAGDGLKAEPAWLNKEQRINLATPVLVDGYLYSQGAKQDYVCVDAATGELQWTQRGFGRGNKDYASTLVLGKKLLILTEDGTLVLAEANPKAYTELGRVQICGSTWCFPAYSNGKLFVRDGRNLSCVDLTSSTTAGL